MAQEAASLPACAASLPQPSSQQNTTADLSNSFAPQGVSPAVADGSSWAGMGSYIGGMPQFPGAGAQPPLLDPATFAAFAQRAAAAGFPMPWMPQLPPYAGFPGWPAPPQPPAQAHVTPPAAQPAAHTAATAAAHATALAASGQPPGDKRFATAAPWNVSGQAALPLMAYQWASQVALTQQQYSAMGWTPPVGAGGVPSWPDPTMTTWPPSTGDTTSFWPAESWANTTSIASPYAPEGSSSAPSGAATNLATSAPAVDNDGIALDIIEKLKSERSESERPIPVIDADAAEAEALANLDEEDKALREDISSAVAQFLAGDDVCFDEGDTEDDCEKVILPALVPIQSLPPPPSEPVSPAPPALAPPIPSATAALVAASDEQSHGPTAEGVNDFLNVLRRRALPAQLTDDKRKHVSNVIYNCVLSLYRDRIQPVQSNVQRRMREKSCSEEMVHALLPLCAREYEMYKILPPSAAQLPIILLIQEPKWFEGFVDVEAADSHYGADAWDALRTFLSDDSVSLPSHPYHAAIELCQVNLPHVQKLALGQIEHMVRLCMGKRKMLMNHGDSLKPTRVARQLEARDKTIAQNAKELCHESGISLAAPPRAYLKRNKGASTPAKAPEHDYARTAREFPLAALPTALRGNKCASTQAKAPEHDQDATRVGEITVSDDLAVVMSQLAQQFPEGVSLSLMKQHVQSHCKLNLNEAAFKFSKLTEEFKLAPLSSMLSLEQVPHRNEFVVSPPDYSAIPNHVWQKYYQLKDHGCLPPPSAASGPPPASQVNVLTPKLHQSRQLGKMWKERRQSWRRRDAVKKCSFRRASPTQSTGPWASGPGAAANTASHQPGPAGGTRPPGLPGPPPPADAAGA